MNTPDKQVCVACAMPTHRDLGDNGLYIRNRVSFDENRLTGPFCSKCYRLLTGSDPPIKERTPAEREAAK